MSKHLYRVAIRFLFDESGPTAVEYAVMLMAIILAVLSTVQVIGGATGGSFHDSSDKIDLAIN